MIYIPSEEQQREHDTQRRLIDEAWRTALHGRITPAIIAYTLTPPGRLTGVSFVWSTEDQGSELRTIAALEKLSPEQGLIATSKAWGDGTWIGVPPGEQGRVFDRETDARRLVRRGKIREAEETWKDILLHCEKTLGETFPALAGIHFNLADFYWEIGRKDQHDVEFEIGLNHLEKSFHHNPGHFALSLEGRIVEMAMVYLERGDILSAKRIYKRLDALNETLRVHHYAPIHINKVIFGSYFEAANRIDEAEKTYLDAAPPIDLQGAFPSFQSCKRWVDIGRFYERQGKFAVAERYYQRLLDVFTSEEPDDMRDSRFHWFEDYKRILRTQGRKKDLQKIDDQLEAIELRVHRRVKPDEAIGYVDLEGNWQIPARYHRAGDFHNGVANVNDMIWGGYTIINRSGEDLGAGYCVDSGSLPFGVSLVHPCTEGLAIISIANKSTAKKFLEAPRHYGYANEKYEIVIEPKFTDAHSFLNGYAVVSVGGHEGGAGCVIRLEGQLYGIIDKTGAYVMEPTFSELRPFTDTLYKYRLGTTGGVVTRDGEILSSLPNLGVFYTLHEGFASADWSSTVEDGDPFDTRYGFINEQGRVAIEPKYCFAYDFSEGFAKVTIDLNGARKVGYIDKHDEMVLPAIYDEADCFREGAAIVKVDEKCGVIDKCGAYLMELMYDKIERWEDGLLRVTHQGKFGLFDVSGKELLKADFDEIGKLCNGLSIIKQGGKFGFADGAGLLVIPPQFSAVRKFENQWAAAAMFDEESRQDLWGMIDRTGNFLIGPRFLDLGAFSEGLASATFSKPDFGKVGYIDTKGVTVIKPKFDFGDPFCEGRAKVGIGEKESRLFGLIDRRGKFIVRPNYKVVQKFSEGLCAVGERTATVKRLKSLRAL